MIAVGEEDLHERQAHTALSLVASGKLAWEALSRFLGHRRMEDHRRTGGPERAVRVGQSGHTKTGVLSPVDACSSM